VRLVRRDEQHIATWNGGTTTEIAIYPEKAVYSRRDFLWRISSATVKVDECNFTLLPGFQRLILILEGELTLDHVGHDRVGIVPFEQDVFDGGWMTRSKGTARDFNVMLARGCVGQVQAVSLEELSTLTISGEKAQEDGRNRKAVVAVYSVDGKIVVDVGNDRTWSLNPGDALLLTTDHPEVMRSVDLSNLGNTPIHAVLATIWYDEPPRRACRRSILP